MRDPRLALLALLTACAAPHYAPPPAIELPPLGAAAEDLSAWWARFGDARLSARIARALEHNQDLRAAAARTAEAAALVRTVDDLLPDANLSARAGRDQTSDRNAFPRFAGIDRRNSAHRVALDVTWELDLWGRIRAGNDAALADLLQTRELQHDLRAALAAQTAQAYFRLVALDLQLALTRTTVQNREDALRIQQQRQRAGAGSALDVHQAEADLESVRAALPALLQAQQAASRALLLLTGETPAVIAEGQLERAAALPAPPAIPEGLPSDLLARRPDVRAAEAALAAASARVAEAKARWFPTIRLTGALGQESEALQNLFTAPATIWSLFGTLTQPLFQLRELGAQADAAAARREQAEAGYVRAVQAAFAETYDALDARAANGDAGAAQQRRIQALEQAERIAAARHDAGAGSFLELLDVRRNLLAARTDRIDTAAAELSATVDVYRALGGGWMPEGGATEAAGDGAGR
ncbi:MAG: efflux transporter outer membrane subunit [Planctomycetota bacterium]